MKQRLLEALRLKELPRAGWLRVGLANVESVAAHSWGVAWLVLTLCPEGVDRERALMMAVIHDLAEVRAGDITPHDGIAVEEKRQREREALAGMLEGLPDRAMLLELFDELEAKETKEAQLVRACDKLDMALQAERYQAEQRIDTREFRQSALREIEALAPSFVGLIEK